MKKTVFIISILLTGALLLTACSGTAQVSASPASTGSSQQASASAQTTTTPAAATSASAQPSSSAALPNPIHDSTAKEILDTFGIKFNIPDTAKNIKYSVIYSKDSAELAQAEFELDSKQYTYRIQSASAFTDISGMYYDWTTKQAIEVSYCKGEVRLMDGQQGVCLWYDAVPGLMYSISTDTGATKENLLDLANKLFVPSKN